MFPRAFNRLTPWILMTGAAVTFPLLTSSRASADPVEIYEDAHRLVEFVSAPFFDSLSLIRVQFVRGKIIWPGEFRSSVSKEFNIRVHNPNFSGHENTSAVVINICRDHLSGAPHHKDLLVLPLTWDGSGFQSESSVMTFEMTTRVVSYTCAQEIALVSNGQWMTDPISGTHNFSFAMADQDD